MTDQQKRFLVHRCLIHGEPILDIIDIENNCATDESEKITYNEVLQFFDKIISDYFERVKWMPPDGRNKNIYPSWYFRGHVIPNGEKPSYWSESFTEPAAEEAISEWSFIREEIKNAIENLCREFPTYSNIFRGYTESAESVWRCGTEPFINAHGRKHKVRITLRSGAELFFIPVE